MNTELTALCWMNGNIIPADKANISVFDHGLLYGDGVFEGLRFYQGKTFLLEAHLDRLIDSAGAISLEIPYDREQLSLAIIDLIKAYGANNGYLRLVVTRGKGSLGIDPQSCKQPQVFIIADRLSLMNAADISFGVKLHIAEVRRTPAICLDPAIKSLNYLNNILARIEANRAGCDEALMLNQDGNICEGSVDNIFLVKDSVLLTPPLSDGMLPGITRRVILDIAKSMQIPYDVRSLIPADLLSADECFLTGTGAELIAVQQVSGKSFDLTRNSVTRQLREGFHKVINAGS